MSSALQETQSGRREMKVYNKLNRISIPANLIITTMFIIGSLMSIIPALFVVAISITEETSIGVYGYQLIPHAFSLKAYEYMFKVKDYILPSLTVTVLRTLCGTLLGLLLNATMAYPLSRRTLPFRNFFSWFIFLPMLFNGGMVSSYLVNTRLLNLRDTFAVLVIPQAVGTFTIILMRTFFQNTVPEEIIESAKMDGARQITILSRIILPLSLPVMATVGLMLSFSYWNEWFTGLLYLTTNRQDLYPLQYVLMSLERQIDFLNQNPLLASYDPSLRARIPAEGSRMAIVVLTILPIACSYPFFQRYFISGLTVGSVKG